jgi:hypothetical protein
LSWFDDNEIPPYAAPCDECFNSYFHYAACKLYNPRFDHELMGGEPDDVMVWRNWVSGLLEEPW